MGRRKLYFAEIFAFFLTVLLFHLFEICQRINHQGWKDTCSRQGWPKSFRFFSKQVIHGFSQTKLRETSNALPGDFGFVNTTTFQGWSANKVNSEAAIRRFPVK